MANLGRWAPLAQQDNEENRVSQDRRDSLELWGQQALRAQQAAQDLWDQSARLALAAQMVWLDLWVRPALQVQSDFRDLQERQARTARLVRRGVPASLARQGLRVL
ncbi:hypothetical protein [Methylobacterium hispanicum]|uniref:hypothetical protein n=1 Tax=Methylobacterium hispanicum TaxID=270350 RepID=UPI002F35D009